MLKELRERHAAIKAKAEQLAPMNESTAEFQYSGIDWNGAKQVNHQFYLIKSDGDVCEVVDGPMSKKEAFDAKNDRDESHDYFVTEYLGNKKINVL